MPALGGTNRLRGTRLISDAASMSIPLGPPRLLPAQTRRLDRFAGPGWLAVGASGNDIRPALVAGPGQCFVRIPLGSYAARNALARDESGVHKFDRLIAQEFDAYLSAARLLRA